MTLVLMLGLVGDFLKVSFEAGGVEAEEVLDVAEPREPAEA